MHSDIIKDLLCYCCFTIILGYLRLTATHVTRVTATSMCCSVIVTDAAKVSPGSRGRTPGGKGPNQRAEVIWQ